MMAAASLCTSRAYGYAVLAHKLNEAGVPHRSAGPGWMHSCIREMLRNPKYVGEFTHVAVGITLLESVREHQTERFLKLDG
jgi:hypothetical protein